MLLNVAQSLLYFACALMCALLWVALAIASGLLCLLPVLLSIRRSMAEICREAGRFWIYGTTGILMAGVVMLMACPSAVPVLWAAAPELLYVLIAALLAQGVGIGLARNGGLGRVALGAALAYGGGLTFLAGAGLLAASMALGLELSGGSVEARPLRAMLGSYAILLTAYAVILGALLALLDLAVREPPKERVAAKFAGRVWIAGIVLFPILLSWTEFQTTLFDNYVFNLWLFVPLILWIVLLPTLRIVLAKGAPRAARNLAAIFAGGFVFFGAVGTYPALIMSAVADEFSLTRHSMAGSWGLFAAALFGAVLVVVWGVLPWVRRGDSALSRR